MSQVDKAVNNEFKSSETQLLILKGTLKYVHNKMQNQYEKTVNLINDCIQAVEKCHDKFNVGGTR